MYQWLLCHYYNTCDILKIRIMTIDGIVLAGGHSHRFGSDKALAKIGNRTMLRIALDNLSVACDHVAVSSGEKPYGAFMDDMIPDVRHEAGPLGGIESAMLKSKAERLLFVTCDMPLISADTLLQMTEIPDRGQAVVWTTEEGEDMSFPMLISRKLLPRLSLFLDNADKENGNRSIKSFLSFVPVDHIMLTEQQKKEFVNVNTHAEFLKING